MSFNSLIADLRHQFETLPDVRKGCNRQVYAMIDAGLSAFSAFFMQSPSFLDYQSRMQRLQGSNNAQSLFGVHLIPSSNQICNLLDPVAPGQSNVIPLPPEFVQPQDGEAKQDCEIAAGKRWLTRWGAQYSGWGVTLLGDDLYCHQPFCEAAKEQGIDFLLVCKPDSHSLLYEWLADFERNGLIQTHRHTWREKGKRLTAHYRYLNEVPLRNRLTGVRSP